MRATTAFNKMLAIPGAYVATVTFTPEGIVVDLARCAKRLRCPCGWSSRAVYDRSTRSWRGLDLGATKLILRAEIRRLSCCRRCGRVRTEDVLWARPGARFTRDFEDVVAWLAGRMDKTAITRLLRCSWEAVANIVGRVVADRTPASPRPRRSRDRPPDRSCTLDCLARSQTQRRDSQLEAEAPRQRRAVEGRACSSSSEGGQARRQPATPRVRPRAVGRSGSPS